MEKLIELKDQTGENPDVYYFDPESSKMYKPLNDGRTLVLNPFAKPMPQWKITEKCYDEIVRKMKDEIEVEKETESEEEVKPKTKKKKEPKDGRSPKPKADDPHGLLIYVDSKDEENTLVKIYKRKKSAYSCNIDTRMRIQEENYLLLHCAEKDMIKQRRDQLMMKYKKEIPSFQFVKYTGGGQVLIVNDEFHLFEELLERFKKRFTE
jgi:hypothetical protein